MDVIAVLRIIVPILPYLGGIAIILFFYRATYKKGKRNGYKEGLSETTKIMSRSIERLESRILNPSLDDLGGVLHDKPEISNIRKTDS